MMGHKASNGAEPRGFLMRLLRDVRANTLILTALSLIPLAGMVGGGVDISRMYIVKTRLQHACDAGALAGRKTMGGGTWAYASYNARTQAEKFFEANYNTEAYGASNVTKAYTENAGKVSGTASAVLPMTLMKIFGRTTETLTVVCDAEMRLPNTDIMFVLDTTGSMAETPAGDNKTKIAGLRIAVKCFYEIVARLDTDAECTTGATGGGTGNQVQIRFGFMPYATNVNVGKLLPTQYFADSWNYQSRERISANWSNWDLYDYYSTNQTATCNTAAANTGSTEYRNYGGSRSPVYYGGGWYCGYERRTSSGGQWRYSQRSISIAPLKNGATWNNSFKLPIDDNGADKTITWNGCIEERSTVRTTDYDPIPTDAYDLDIDLIPTGSAVSKWGAALPGLIYTRNGTNSRDWNMAQIDTSANYGNGSNFYCPTEAKKLQTWANADLFDDYVDSLKTDGNTYHDIGLLWGARFASPTGIFSAENDFTSQGGEIERHIIFMTDGDTNTQPTDYTAYGVPWFDRRQTPANTVPTQAVLDEQVDLRFAAICSRIRNSNKFTLWVISFGSVNASTETRLRNCATAGRYFSASNSAALQTTFKSIADQISQLRLTK